MHVQKGFVRGQGQDGGGGSFELREGGAAGLWVGERDIQVRCGHAQRRKWVLARARAHTRYTDHHHAPVWTWQCLLPPPPVPEVICFRWGLPHGGWGEMRAKKSLCS